MVSLYNLVSAKLDIDTNIEHIYSNLIQEKYWTYVDGLMGCITKLKNVFVFEYVRYSMFFFPYLAKTDFLKLVLKVVTAMIC